MPISRDDLLISISTDAKEAVKGLKDVEGGLHGLAASARGAEDQLSGFGFAAVKINETLELVRKAAESMAEVWDKTVGRFHEMQDATLRLSGAISIMGGKDVQGATKRMLEFADAIQETTVIGREQTINMLEMAKAAGQSDEMSRKLTKSAIDMGASGIMPTEEALRGLIMTLKGQGRAVGEASIFLRGLTEDQLKAGEGVDLLAKRFDGFSKIQVATFSGALKQAKNLTAEVFEKIGEIVAKGLRLDAGADALKNFVATVKSGLDSIAPKAIESLGKIRATVDGLTTALSRVDFTGLAKSAAIVATVLAGGGLATALPRLIAALPAIGTALGGLMASLSGAAAALAPILAIVAAFTALAFSVDIVVRNMDRLPQLAKAFMDAWRVAIDYIGKFFLQVVRGILGATGMLVSKLGELIPGMSGASDKAVASIGEGFDAIQSKIDDFGKAADLNIAKLAEDSKGLDFGLAGKLKEQLDNIVKNFQTAFAKSAKTTLPIGPKLPTGAAPGGEAFTSKFKLFSEDDIKEIKAAFGSGPSGFATSVGLMTQVPMGMMGAAGIFLDAAQKLIEFIPGILNKIAGIINAFTSLPTMISSAFNNVIKSMHNFVSNFIPNIFKMFEHLLDSILSLFEKGPDLISKLIEKFPGMIMHLADRIPEFVKRLLTAIIAGGPKIIAAFFQMIRTGWPALIKDMVKQLPILLRAIRDGIVQGFIDGWHAILNGFKGFNPINTKDLSNTFKNLTDGVQKQSSKLFAVIDANSANVGNNTAKQIADAIDGATNRAEGILKHLWAVLKGIWEWVLDHIVTPIGDAIMKAWKWVDTNIIQPISTVVQKAWQWVIDKVYTPLADVVSKAWQWVDDHILKPIQSIVQPAWQWVYDKIIKPLSTIGADAWGWVYDNIITPLKRGFTWLDDFANSVGRLFKTPEWLQGFIDAVNKMADAFKSMGGGGNGGELGKLTGGVLSTGGGLVYAAGGAFMRRGNDSIPAMYEPGEFVVRRRAVNAVGVGMLQAINQTGQVPSGGDTHLNIQSMTIENHGDKVDDTFVRQKLMPAFLKELKKESNRGGYLMSTRGLRNV